jgi:hypothetical protein
MLYACFLFLQSPASFAGEPGIREAPDKLISWVSGTGLARVDGSGPSAQGARN